MTPVISVITIFLNAEAFLEEAVASLNAQTMTDWELLLVDDGSDDGSTAMAKGLAARDPARVRYLEHPGHANRGMSASRNLGLSHARGRYVTFLDSDDVLMPDALEQASSILDSHPEVGTVYAATLYWYSWTGNAQHQGQDALDFSPGRGVPPGTLAHPPELLTRFLSQPEAVPCMCSLVARRALVEEVGGFEESFRGLYEDQVYYAKLALAAPVLVVGQTWSKYRQHPNSCCAVEAGESRVAQARSRYLNWLAGYLPAVDVRQMEVWEALDRERRLNLLVSEVSGGPQGRATGTAAGPVLHHAVPHRVRGWLRRLGDLAVGKHSSVDSLSGQRIDAYYADQFLSRHGSVIRGSVLELVDGGATRNLASDPGAVCDVRPVMDTDGEAKILEILTGDLGSGPGDFDCLILANVLHRVFDVAAAIRAANRRLRPGGVLLATMPGMAPRRDRQRSDPPYWVFTSRSAYRAFVATFPHDDLRVTTYGNPAAATALLKGVPAERMARSTLDAVDPRHEVVIAVFARKSPVS